MPWNTTVDKCKNCFLSHFPEDCFPIFAWVWIWKNVDKQKGWMLHGSVIWPIDPMNMFASHHFSKNTCVMWCYVWPGYGGSFFKRVNFMQEQEGRTDGHAYCDLAATTASSWEVASGNFQRSSLHAPMDEHFLSVIRCHPRHVKSMPPDICFDMLRSGDFLKPRLALPWHCSLRVPWLDSLSSIPSALDTLASAQSRKSCGAGWEKEA